MASSGGFWQRTIPYALFGLLFAVSIGAWKFSGWNAATSLLTIATAASGLTAFWVDLNSRKEESPKLDEVAGKLAENVKKQWEKADEHDGLSDPLPVHYRASNPARGLMVAWEDIVRVARSSAGRGPTNDTKATGPQDLKGELADIATVFARVPTQRLVVLGEGGAGKSVLARRLTLYLLRSRRRNQRVPMLLPVASWNPKQSLDEWLADQLAVYLRTAGVTGRRGQQSLANQLVDNHKILPILDGFDEIPKDLRGEAIRRLNKSRVAKDQLLLTSRIKEYAEAVGEAGCLEAAAVVELLPLGPKDVATYLYLRASGGAIAARWEPVIAELTAGPPASPVAQALTTPLMVTLAAAVYYNPPPADDRDFFAPDAKPDVIDTADGVREPRELLDCARFGSREAIEGYLLDEFIPAAYRADDADRRRSRWTADQALRWHTFLACHLTKQGAANPAGNLAWWELWQATPRRLRSITFGLAAALSVSLGHWLLLGLPLAAQDPRNGTALEAVGESLVYGAIAGLAGGWVTAAGLGNPPRHPSGGLRLQRSQIVPVLVAGLAVSVLSSVLFRLAVAAGPVVVSPTASLTIDVPVVLAFGLLTGLLSGGFLLRFVTPAAVNLRTNVNPRKVLARDRATFVVFGLIGWPLVVLVAAFVGMLVVAIGTALVDKSGGVGPGLSFLWMTFAVISAFGLYGVGLVWGWSRASWGHFALARGWLAFRRRLPWRLMAFLNDAYERGVLRQVGPYYQFRYIAVQYRLMATETRLASLE